MFLLIICIGFAPLQSINAGNLDHMESMPSNCAMDSGADSDVCDGAQCMMSAGSCGANNILSISQATLCPSMALMSPGDYFHSVAFLYQSHLNFSIYRPPIT